MPLTVSTPPPLCIQNIKQIGLPLLWKGGGGKHSLGKSTLKSRAKKGLILPTLIVKEISVPGCMAKKNFKFGMERKDCLMRKLGLKFIIK